jgi:hypothetical protein
MPPPGAMANGKGQRPMPAPAPPPAAPARPALPQRRPVVNFSGGAQHRAKGGPIKPKGGRDGSR